MQAVTKSLLILIMLAGCGSEDSRPSSNDEEPRVFSVAVGSRSLSLTSTQFGLDPMGASVSFDCNGTPDTFHFIPVDQLDGTWTFTGTVPKYCITPVLENIKFKRQDVPAAGTRTVPKGNIYIADPLGGASYKLDGATFYVDYWGDYEALSTTVDVDHSDRFASYSFAFTAGHSCPVASGTLTLSNTEDRFVITMPHDGVSVPLTMTGSGDAGFIGPATNNSTSIDYEFTFESLAPDTVTDYSVTVEATWDDNPNPDAYCGGTLDFRMVARHFSLTLP